MSLNAHINEQASDVGDQVDLNRSGIYKITNSVSGKIYIGSAVNIRKRWNLHLLHLRRGTHRNRKMQASFAKHGEAAFSILVIEFCDLAALLEREQFWMDGLEAVKVGYNLNPVAGSGLGQKRPFKNLTPDHRRKIGESKFGRARPPFADEWKAKLADVARRPRPRQSERMKTIWAARESKRVDLVCGCGFVRSIVRSSRGKFAEAYQCRPCYLSNGRAA